MMGSAPPFDAYVDMDPAKAVTGAYAVITTEDGASFVAPVPWARTTQALYAVVPYSSDWNVLSVTMQNLPVANDRKVAVTVTGDFLALRKPIATVSITSPRPQWCFWPDYQEVSYFQTAGGGCVSISCEGCSDGSFEICGGWSSCPF